MNKNVNDTKYKVRMNMYVPIPLREWIVKNAYENKMSMNEFVCKCLSEYSAEYDNKKHTNHN